VHPARDGVADVVPDAAPAVQESQPEPHSADAFPEQVTEQKPVDEPQPEPHSADAFPEQVPKPFPLSHPLLQPLSHPLLQPLAQPISQPHPVHAAL